MRIDDRGLVWIAGNRDQERQLLNSAPDCTFVMQIGKPSPQTNGRDTRRLGKPANVDFDLAVSEVCVADGYDNRRIFTTQVDTDSRAPRRLFRGDAVPRTRTP